MGRMRRNGRAGGLAALALSFGLGFGTTGCGPKLNPGGSGDSLLSPGCTPASVTYATGASAIVNKSCARSGCHVQGATSPNLAGADAAKAGFINGGLSMTQVGTMPYMEGKLAGADLCVLENWAEGGYLP